MSQSDYVKYKRVSTELKNFTKKNKTLPPVLMQSDLLNYREYNLENSITDTNIAYNRLKPNGANVVFGMFKTPLSCTTVFGCSNTNLLPNRVPMSAAYYVPTPQHLTWNQTKNARWLKNGCKCALNRSYSQKYVCNCKIAV